MRSENDSRTKRILRSAGSILLQMAIGAVCGVVLMLMLADILFLEASLPLSLLSILMIFAACLDQILLHEAGHLVFGFLEGYHFVSFRILSWMLVKKPDGYHIKRYSVPSTLGQCLMEPDRPEQTSGFWYNAGGVIFNLASALLCLIFYLTMQRMPVLSSFLLANAVFGTAIGLMNGIPLKNKQTRLGNDGFNAMHLSRNVLQTGSLYQQLKVNALQNQEIRLKDMPAGMFASLEEIDMEDPLSAPCAVMLENRYMDARDFDKAKQAGLFILSHSKALPSIYLGLVKMDLCCIAILEEDYGLAGEYRKDKDVEQGMRTLKNYPAVLRTRYILAAIVDDDWQEAEKVRQLMQRIKKVWPNVTDFESEEEMMEILPVLG